MVVVTRRVYIFWAPFISLEWAKLNISSLVRRLIVDSTDSYTSMLDQSDENLHGPHVARQQQLSIDLRPTSAANPPAAAAILSIDETDGRTDGHWTVCDALTAYYADRVIIGYRSMGRV